MFSLFSLIIYILIAAIGFMMGFLFKNAQSNNLVINPNPEKTFRQFLTVFTIGVVILSALAYFSVRALSVASVPEEGAIQFKNIKSVFIFLLSIFFMGLTFTANYYTLSIKKLRVLPYILIACFYILFILIDVHYISDRFITWEQTHNMLTDEAPDFRPLGWVKCGLGASVTALNAFLMWWGKKK